MVAFRYYPMICLFCVTHTTCGLLSEYKICGDAECESRISRVQAIQDHYSKDCRFLNFRQGEIIFVYHKLTGEREDLWAGSIDRKFGYFSKDVVKEEETFATTETILKTQRSDFFCIDENGYPVDTSELDNNANNLFLPETTKTVSNTWQSSSRESQQTSVSTKTKSEQEEDSKDDENFHEQAGSSSWLRSSVTGLWELVQKDDATVHKEDKKEEMGESSLTSSVTGWLGFGGKLNGESNQESKLQDKEALVSPMTDWFGFGRNSKAYEKDHERERVQDEKSVEVFRGRKIALDLQEDNQFSPEEKKESGTLDWIGNGISTTLGFGLNTKESRQESASYKTEKLEPASSSWFDVGITDMLGLSRAVAEGDGQKQKDSPVAEQDNYVIPSSPSPKQHEVTDTETEAKTNVSLDADINETADEHDHNKSECVTDVKLENKKEKLETSETSSNGNELSHLSYETIKLNDPRETDEDTALSNHTGPSYGYMTDLQRENIPSEYTQNLWEEDASKAESDEGETIPKRDNNLDNTKDSETDNLLQSNKEQEVQIKSAEEYQEEMSSIIKVNGIQEVVNERPDMSEEMIGTYQNIEGKERLKGEVKDEGIGETEVIFKHLGQIKKNTEPQYASEVDKEEHVSEVESGEIMVNEDNIEEFVEKSHEDWKHESKEEGSELDKVTPVSDVEDNAAWLAIEESDEKNLDTTNDLNKIKVIDEKSNNFDEKENSQQLIMEDTDNKVDSKSTEDLQEIVSKYKEESTSHQEIIPNPKDTEKNVFEEINHSIFMSETAELFDQRKENLNVKEENSEKSKVNLKSSNHNADLNKFGYKMAESDNRNGVYTVEKGMEVAASQNVLNEAAINGLYESTASSDINDKIQDENGEASGLFRNAFSLFTYAANSKTTDLNSETTTEEPQANIMINEETDQENNVKDIPHSHVFPSAQSPTVTTINPKTPHKLYHNILASMSTIELEILIQHFGEHKMQFLDYMLGSLDAGTGEHDTDSSILLDIERLMNYHMERLMATNMRGNYIPEEDKDKSRTLIAMEKVQLVLEKVKESFKMFKPDGKEQEQDILINKNINNGNMEEMHSMRDKHILNGQRHNTKGATNQMLDFLDNADVLRQIHATMELFTWLTGQVVSVLPEDIRPGPDLYGVPWEPVIISGLVGFVTVLLFVCRCFSSVKSRMYRSKERWMAEQVAQLLDEKCKVLETLSKVQQEYNGVEDSLRDSGILAQTQKTIQLEAKAKQLELTKKEFESDLKQLKDRLNQQREHSLEQEQRIMTLEENITTCEEETKMFQSQEEQEQTTLKVYSMNSDRLQRNLETAGEENTLLRENNIHLQQQLEGWAERVSELEEEMRRCEHSHSGMLQDVATKDERIMSLTDRLLQMKAWDSDLEGEQGTEEERETANGTAGSGEANGTGAITDTQGHLQKVQKLIHAAKLNADLKSVDEDKDRIFAKLNDEVKAKNDLQGSIKDLENEKLSLQSDTMHYSDQMQVLQQKLQIMTEMYQENELKLHRLLTVEEKERLQKEEKLTKADKNITMAMEELNNYRQRAEEMEEELEKTKQSYQTQISSHEKKAHNNWLAARSAERELADIRRENALLRQKLTDTQFKLEAIEKDPYALDSLARPLPFRGRPASETRAFLSPPTLMDGPPNRLSPRVAMRGPLEGDMERTGPHSDSGSISPIWERDRRGPSSGPMPGGPPGPLSGPLPGTMPPPGYIFPEPGAPVYRRPPPGPMGLHPAPAPLPPRGIRLTGPPADTQDGLYRESSLGPGEHDQREPSAGERRTPPEADLRLGGMPTPGPMMGPMDGPFPRRAPYGPPPSEYYLPRGPGGPPMPVWGPPPSGMMYPPRFPPGGPPPPHMPPYSGPPLRPLVADEHPPLSIGPSQPPIPAQTQRQSPEEHTPSPQDII